MGSQEKDCKRNLLSENCMMQNNTKNWITVLELLRGYLQNLEVHIDDSEMMTHILFFFWSGLQGPKAYSLWYGVVPKPSIG